MRRSTIAVVYADHSYDGNGRTASQRTTGQGTSYDQSPEIRADSDRFNQGTAYDVNLVGNTRVEAGG